MLNPKCLCIKGEKKIFFLKCLPVPFSVFPKNFSNQWSDHENLNDEITKYFLHNAKYIIQILSCWQFCHYFTGHSLWTTGYLGRLLLAVNLFTPFTCVYIAWLLITWGNIPDCPGAADHWFSQKLSIWDFINHLKDSIGWKATTYRK